MRNDNDWFFDKWENDRAFNKSAKRITAGLIAAWVAFIVIDLAVLGFILWLAYTLVQWVITK